MKKLFTYLIALLFLYACSTTKYVNGKEQLLVKNTIVMDNSTLDTDHLKEYLVQRPNYELLLIPYSLYFYNLGNPGGVEEIYEWKEKYKKPYKTLSKIFSEKQAKTIAKSSINFNQWFLKNGEPPSVLSKTKTTKSEKNLKTYLQNKGFFNSNVWSIKNNISKNKAEVTYYITKGKPIIIDSMSYQIDSPDLDSLYNKNKQHSFLKKQQYNNEDFINEANRLTDLFKNNGIYNFSKNDISFNVDTISKNEKASIHTFIRNRKNEKNGKYTSKPYKIRTIRKVNVYTDSKYNNNKEEYNPIVQKTYKGINFLAEDELNYKPKRLTESIFIRPNQIYNYGLRNRTVTHLASLKNFKRINIKYIEVNDNELDVNIYLSPTPPFILGGDTGISRSNIRQRELSAKFSFTSKNTFKGTELLKFSGFGSFFKTDTNNGWEFGGDISLETPRFMVPFPTEKLINKKMFPKTRFFTGASFQKNIGLDRYLFNIGMEYKWKSTTQTSNHLEPLNCQYIKNYNVFKYFDIYRSEFNKIKDIAEIKNAPASSTLGYDKTVGFMNFMLKDTNLKNSFPKEYQSLRNVVNRHDIVTSNFLLLTSSYAFTYNSKKDMKDNNSTYFKIRVANSGLGLGYLIKEDNFRDKSTLLKIPLAQYLKFDTEYKKFISLNQHSVLGIRLAGGIIIPYNKSDIPFSKSYFAGGSNDIRAWKTYQLGPGNRPEGLEYNVGNLKLLGNLEYRFDLFSELKGALFVDAGNIWNIFNVGIKDDEAEINDINPLNNIAIGTGFGIRYDFKILVGRLDLGYKVLEPNLKGNKWFENTTYKESVWNIGINYPF